LIMGRAVVWWKELREEVCEIRGGALGSLF